MMRDEVRKDAIAGVMDSMIASIENEYENMTQEEVAGRWYFTFNPEHSLEWNIYQFNDMMELYRSSCRRWETLHNGSQCVVERVRDKYLMPKIKEFSKNILDNYNTPSTPTA